MRCRSAALLIKGRLDLVTADDQVDAYRRAVRQGETAVFRHSSHFPRVEEAARYAHVVDDFMKSTGQ